MKKLKHNSNETKNNIFVKHKALKYGVFAVAVITAIVLVSMTNAITSTSSEGASTSSASDIVWAKNFGGSYIDRFESVITVEDGYVAVGASFSGSFGNAIMVKFDTNGNVVWAKNFGGSGDEFNSVVVVDGGYVAVGFSNPGSFGKGDWVGVAGKGSADAIVVKFDTNGNVVWAKNFGGSDFDEFNSVVAVGGGYVAVGHSWPDSFGSGDWTGVAGKGNGGAIMVKFDTIGNVVWAKNFGGSGDKFNSVVAVGGGYVAVGASQSGSFGNGDWAGVAGKGSADAIIVKFDTIGNVVWAKNFGGSDGDGFSSIIAVNDGYVVVGVSNADSFGSGDWAGVAGKGNMDAIIVKFDTIGNVVWAKNFGGSDDDGFFSIIAVNDGYIAVGISYSGSFGNGDWTGVAGKGSADAIVVKFDTNGNVVWAKNFGGNGDDGFFSAVAVSDGYVVVGVSDADSFGNSDWAGVVGNGSGDATIMKFGVSGATDSGTGGTDDSSGGGSGMGSNALMWGGIAAVIVILCAGAVFILHRGGKI